MLKPFFVWYDRKLRIIRPETVAFLESDKNYTYIFIPVDYASDVHKAIADAKKEKKDKEESQFYRYMVRTTLAGALKKLPRGMFIRTHRSYAVSIYYIDNISRTNLDVGNESIPIARQYYERVIGKLNVME